MTRALALTKLTTLTISTMIMLGLAACSTGESVLANPGSTNPKMGASLVVGSANFPESHILAEIYSGALQGAGISSSTRPNLGSREVYVKALQDGSIDLIPDYSGNLLRYADKDATAVSPGEVMNALPAQLPADLKVLDASGAEDKDSIVVTEATAEKYSLRSLADLGKICNKISLGMPPEAQGRPQGLPGLKANYGCVPANFLPFSDGGGPVTVKALLDGKIQAADVFTTSPLIAQNHLVTLADPLNNFAAQQVVPLIRTDKVSDKTAQVLNKVSASLTTHDLILLNERVSGSTKQNPKDVAAAWLRENGLGR
jgi:osmoprotectant transport system substrate-binding protein